MVQIHRPIAEKICQTSRSIAQRSRLRPAAKPSNKEQAARPALTHALPKDQNPVTLRNGVIVASWTKHATRVK
eukprot:4295535-Amphidinium_carterae.1